MEYAALPPLSGSERGLLSELEPATRKAWLVAEHRRLVQGEWWKQAARLAVAAGLGALVATGALTLRGSRAPAVAEPVTVKRAVLEARPTSETPSDEANLSDDEVFFEVSWPQATEGDL